MGNEIADQSQSAIEHKVLGDVIHQCHHGSNTLEIIGSIKSNFSSNQMIVKMNQITYILYCQHSLESPIGQKCMLRKEFSTRTFFAEGPKFPFVIDVYIVSFSAF